MRREVHARCGRGPAGNDRRKRRHRARGPTSLPGDGAAGDQGAQNRPACPAMAARDACGLSRLNDLLALWSQAHLPSCNRQVTSSSIHMAKPGPATAPAVTHRYKRTHCLWLEQFQIADLARFRELPSRPGRSAQIGQLCADRREFCDASNAAHRPMRTAGSAGLAAVRISTRWMSLLRACTTTTSVGFVCAHCRLIRVAYGPATADLPGVTRMVVIRSLRTGARGCRAAAWSCRTISAAGRLQCRPGTSG